MTPADGGAAEEALFDALHTLERLRDLTPMRAAAFDADEMHGAVRAIAGAAVYRLTPALAARQERDATGLETEAAAPGTGEKLLKIARDFIDKHRVSCAEATANDGVYEEAPLLVEALAEVAGYYSYPDDDR